VTWPSVGRRWAGLFLCQTGRFWLNGKRKIESPEVGSRPEERETAEAEALKMEQECAAATLALYLYAAIHVNDITVKNGELAFSTESVRLEFSGQLENSKSLFSKWQTAVQELARRQLQARARLPQPTHLRKYRPCEIGSAAPW